MNALIRPSRFVAAALAALALNACAAGSYTGPVEVTRFIAANPDGLGQGSIVVYFPDEMSNQTAKAAFAAAVENELRALGYAIVQQEGQGIQVAAVRTSRNPIEGAGTRSRSPVTVGGGASTGTFGSGAGLGIGINLGGGRSGPAAISELSVRITNDKVETLWEGRAQIATSVNSPYSDVDTAARALAKALFRDFPGGNGETVSIDVDDL